jgi:hypothetical protein
MCVTAVFLDDIGGNLKQFGGETQKLRRGHQETCYQI